MKVWTRTACAAAIVPALAGCVEVEFDFRNLDKTALRLEITLPTVFYDYALAVEGQTFCVSAPAELVAETLGPDAAIETREYEAGEDTVCEIRLVGPAASLNYFSEGGVFDADTSAEAPFAVLTDEGGGQWQFELEWSRPAIDDLIGDPAASPEERAAQQALYVALLADETVTIAVRANAIIESDAEIEGDTAVFEIPLPELLAADGTPEYGFFVRFSDSPN